MKKVDLGQTIQTVANVGVLAGIVFLAYELRQNTLATRMMATESHLATAMAPNELTVANPQFSDLLAKANSSGDLTPGEEGQLNAFYGIRLRGWQNAFLQYESGVLDEELLRGYDETVSYFILNSDRFREYWLANTSRYSDAFTEHVQSVLASAERE